MTNKERLLALVGFQPGEHAAEAALLDNSLTASTEYVATAYPAIRLAAIQLIETLLSTPNTSNSVTGYAVTYDRAAIEKRLAALKNEAGIGADRVTFIRPW